MYFLWRTIIYIFPMITGQLWLQVWFLVIVLTIFIIRVLLQSSRHNNVIPFILKAGLAKSVDRQIKIAPWSCKVSGFTEAVEGVNYVPFDDPEMVKNLVLPADSVQVKIPVIVTYDPSIAGTAKSFVVGLKLIDSGDLRVMGTNFNITVVDKAARTHACVRFNQSSL